MPTVQQIVHDELEKNPYLVEMLQQELVNVTAVALKLLPSIEKLLKRKIDLSAVSMAIRRYTETVQTQKLFHWKFPKNLEIATKSNIYEVAFERTPDVNRIINLLYKKINRQKGEFLSIAEGTYEIVIFTNQSNKNIVQEALKRQHITSELDNLAYVTVNWAKITKDIPGIYYRITRTLAFKNISIQSFHTIGAEMMIFFKEDVFVDAYKTIVELLQNKREL